MQRSASSALPRRRAGPWIYSDNSGDISNSYSNVTDHLPHLLVQPKYPDRRTSHGRQPPDLRLRERAWWYRRPWHAFNPPALGPPSITALL